MVVASWSLVATAWLLAASVDSVPAEAAYRFEDYISDFYRKYKPAEVEQRRHAFEEVLRRVAAHNAKPGMRWKAGVNELSDRTREELQRLLGYDKIQAFNRLSSRASEPSMMLSAEPLPASFDWRAEGVVTAVKEQHTCQGCWAFAAVEAIESAFALSGEALTELSVEQLVSCTPNPEHCGGSGGCGGATAEQAFNYSAKAGLTTEAAYPYKHYPFSRHDCEAQQHAPAATVGGFVRLPPNDDQALVSTLVQHGPVVVTVAAASWLLYDGGIFDGELGMGCGADLNHQVLLVGYGQDKGDNYWLVRNSYGPKWGEQGYIRVLRAASGQKEVCQDDNQPADGYCGQSGWCRCPESIKVCGMCGILADSSYPTSVGKAAGVVPGSVVTV
eukprot:TRINITY_DN17686_c0_g2_i8.p1 TRINITY_DN17686_c0_g2~~TRINITY_DN17686_c0_g2_i8.p1  ORF type:complete len:387 (+),score=71.72 TRINITY_DN17686_c0_g2_i8:190-1350(+)